MLPLFSGHETWARSTMIKRRQCCMSTEGLQGDMNNKQNNHLCQELTIGLKLQSHYQGPENRAGNPCKLQELMKWRQCCTSMEGLQGDMGYKQKSPLPRVKVLT